eukprot:TRINITY_DN6569_c0_g1_i1.p1 TRINITY_DN6569_c0_g1~~TRINITY_DN6569_c0_g1_i1.p1  ORF type:complete len:153 (+),score=14.57 TRINITY_DN6569_c0_g1_i1:818-1276(+)
MGDSQKALPSPPSSLPPVNNPLQPNQDLLNSNVRGNQPPTQLGANQAAGYKVPASSVPSSLSNLLQNHSSCALATQVSSNKPNNIVMTAVACREGDEVIIKLQAQIDPTLEDAKFNLANYGPKSVSHLKTESFHLKSTLRMRLPVSLSVEMW